MHMQDYINLKTRIIDLKRKLITIHAKFKDIRQFFCEPKQANNKDVGISYLGTKIMDPNHLTLTILSFGTFELAM